MEKTEQETRELKDALRKARKEAKKRYPIVMKNSKSGNLEIIYQDRIELYKLEGKETFSETDENKVADAYAEIEMASGCGFRRVNDTTEKEDWRFK